MKRIIISFQTKKITTDFINAKFKWLSAPSNLHEKFLAYKFLYKLIFISMVDIYWMLLFSELYKYIK